MITNEMLTALFNNNTDIIDEDMNLRKWAFSSTIKKDKQLSSLKSYRISCGCTKCCIVFNDLDFVIKWSTDKADYVAREEENYKEAVRRHLGFLFPKTECIGYINGYHIIKQEKVYKSVRDLDYCTKHDLIKKFSCIRSSVWRFMCNTIYDANFWKESYPEPIIDKTWVNALTYYYGKKTARRFADFTNDNCINDLHLQNIGYTAELRPIIFDFSGCGTDSSWN